MFLNSREIARKEIGKKSDCIKIILNITEDNNRMFDVE